MEFLWLSQKQLGMSNSYFSEGYVYHQPGFICPLAAMMIPIDDDGILQLVLPSGKLT